MNATIPSIRASQSSLETIRMAITSKNMAIRHYENTERTSMVDIVVDLRRTERTFDGFKERWMANNRKWERGVTEAEGVTESLAFICDVSVPVLSIGSKLISFHDDYLKLYIL